MYIRAFPGFGTNGQKGFGGNLGLWDQTQALRWSVKILRKFIHSLHKNVFI
jgi:carboxylesterase type B